MGRRSPPAGASAECAMMRKTVAVVSTASGGARGAARVCVCGGGGGVRVCVTMCVCV